MYVLLRILERRARQTPLTPLHSAHKSSPSPAQSRPAQPSQALPSAKFDLAAAGGRWSCRTPSLSHCSTWPTDDVCLPGPRPKGGKSTNCHPTSNHGASLTRHSPGTHPARLLRARRQSLDSPALFEPPPRSNLPFGVPRPSNPTHPHAAEDHTYIRTSVGKVRAPKAKGKRVKREPPTPSPWPSPAVPSILGNFASRFTAGRSQRLRTARYM